MFDVWALVSANIASSFYIRFNEYRIHRDIDAWISVYIGQLKSFTGKPSSYAYNNSWIIYAKTKV